MMEWEVPLKEMEVFRAIPLQAPNLQAVQVDKMKSL